jgi:hypothetical protein
MTAALAEKGRFVLVVLFLALALFLLVYRLLLYTPPLLDAGRRNIVDKTIDFLYCGWHMTKGSFIKDYLKDQGTAYGDFFKAGWYREKMLLKVFRFSKAELTLFLESRKGLDRRILADQLYQFAMSHPEERAAQFRQAGLDFFERGNRDMAARAFACVFLANPADPLGYLGPGLGFFYLNHWLEAAVYFQYYFQASARPGSN